MTFILLCRPYYLMPNYLKSVYSFLLLFTLSYIQFIYFLKIHFLKPLLFKSHFKKPSATCGSMRICTSL